MWVANLCELLAWVYVGILQYNIIRPYVSTVNITADRLVYGIFFKYFYDKI